MIDDNHNNVSSNPFNPIHTAQGNSLLSRELLSNKIPPVEADTDYWRENVHLRRLSDNLISSITSAPLYNCLNYISEDLTLEEQAENSQRCIETFYMGDGHLNYSEYLSHGATASGVVDVLKVLPQPDFPEELTHINMTNLVAYSILFPLAAVGNLLVLVALFRSRHRKSRVNLMILHLSLADMIVTFIFLPMEITWQVTIQWEFGMFGCKLYKFFSAFGFYMSSMVLVCISLDRYFAVLHPLRVNDAQRRGKIMLFFAWVISAFISLPQSIVFSVQSHPQRPSFQQCVSFGFFDGIPAALMVYTVFCICFLYFLPLTIILVAYTRIIVEISKKSKETQCEQSMPARSGAHHHSTHQQQQQYRTRLPLRRSNMSSIERARTRTLRMTFIIVMAFIWCWTPYALGTLWNFIDSASFMSMNKHLQDVLFILAVSNSVVNPLIYGRYSIPCCRNLLQGNRAVAQRRQQMMRLQPHLASLAEREPPSRPANLVPVIDAGNVARTDRVSLGPHLGSQSGKGSNLVPGASVSYEEDNPPPSGEVGGANESREASVDGVGGVGSVGPQSSPWLRYGCWCCCAQEEVSMNRFTCKHAGFCHGSPGASRSNATLYTHTTRDRMVVKLLSFLHDLNRPVPPGSLPPDSELGMIPLTVLQPAKTLPTDVELTRIHSSRLHPLNHPPAKIMATKKSKTPKRGHSKPGHKLSSLQQLRHGKKSRYGYRQPAALKYPGGLGPPPNTAPVFHMSQQSTLRYSPARLASMLQHKPMYHAGKAASETIGMEMMLHVNDYSYDTKNPNRRLGDNLDTAKAPREMDSYEESSGYSSSHVQIRSCQNMAGTNNAVQEEYSVWEHHNSC